MFDIHLWQLQGILNAAARLISRRRKFDSISSTIRDVLHWLPIRQRVHFKLSVLVFNSLHNLAPSYLMDMCQPIQKPSSTPPSFCLPSLTQRSTHEDSPLRSTQLSCRRSVKVEALSTPLHNHELSSASFRRQLKTEHIIIFNTLVTLFTVTVGEHNFNVIISSAGGGRITSPPPQVGLLPFDFET